MAIAERPENRVKTRFVDKKAILEQLRQQDEGLGYPEWPVLTGEELQEMLLKSMIDRGIDPASVPLASREIEAMREE